MPEQPHLFESLDDGALLLPAAEKRKRYTADQAAALETQTNAVLMLIASGWPTEEIASRLKLNRRTVEALVLRDTDAAMAARGSLAETLQKLASRWYGRAITKDQGADFKDLVTAANATMQRANEARVAAGMDLTAGKENALEVDVAGLTPLDRVKRLLALPAADPSPVDSQSNERKSESVDLQKVESLTSHQMAETGPERNEPDPPGGGCFLPGGRPDPRYPESEGKFAMDLPPESAVVSGKILPENPPVDVPRGTSGASDGKELFGLDTKWPD